ncbi:MAG: ADP-ribosylglycohydrolase family protein [Promethearchaeota archaeon]
MIGAIVGDIVGSRFEYSNFKQIDFELFTEENFFTDDSVLTIAIADAILHNIPFEKKLKEYCRRYPDAGYGGLFYRWVFRDLKKPYNSWGNGSAMRVSPIGWAHDNLETVIEMAKKSAEVTHNHPEGIKGAQATASAIYLSRIGKSKEEIKTFIEDRFKYNLNFSINDLRPIYHFDVSCQGSVPPAIRAFIESNSFEDSIRLVISLGGDSDTLGAINGAIAHAFYGIPKKIKEKALTYLDDELIFVIKEFCAKYNCY